MERGNSKDLNKILDKTLDWLAKAKSEYVENLAVGELNERKNDGRQ